MSIKTFLLLLTIVFGFLFTPLKAQDTANYLQTRVIADSLEIPWDMHWGSDYKIWFSERNGDIHRLDPNSGELEHIYTITDVYQSWDNSGLHAFALHPDFPNTPYAYAHFTYRDYRSRLIRLVYDGNSESFASFTVLIDDIPGNSSHNGSRLVFDDNGFLFLCTGDAFSGSQTAQDVSNTGGKILRMHGDGSIPEDNPFGNYTWSFGHRNPQGLVFTSNGTLFSSEHGTGVDDEVNIIEKGRNYGWEAVEGFCDDPSEQDFCNEENVKEPVTVWTPTEAPCGMAYFDHPAIPEWQNSLLLGFLKQKELKVLHLNGDQNHITQEIPYFTNDFGRIRDVLVLPNGRIFIATSNQETNGAAVVKPDDDKIIEIYNPAYEYENIGLKEHILSAKLYPNPAKNQLNISLSSEFEKLEGIIYSLQGQKVLDFKIEDQQTEGPVSMNIEDLKSGTYILVLKTGSGEKTQARFQILRN